MEIKVNITKKLMPRTDKNDPKSRPEIVNHIISYPDHTGRLRHNTEDEIKEISANLQEVISEIDKWHSENPKEEVSSDDA